MPANWADTEAKEKAWKRAKEIFKDQTDKAESNWGDSEWAQVMAIAKNIHKNERVNKKTEAYDDTTTYSLEGVEWKQANIIEVKKEVQIGEYILEEGDKIRVIEQQDMGKLAKTVKQLLIQNGVRFKKIAYDEDEIIVALGMDFPDSLFDKFWDTLESNGYSYDEYQNIITVSGDFGAPRMKRV